MEVERSRLGNSDGYDGRCKEPTLDKYSAARETMNNILRELGLLNLD
jgi:hypothetical protein